MASTPIDPSPKKRTSRPDGLVELKPPPDAGFGGTALFHAREQAALITELLKRGYTRVEAA